MGDQECFFDARRAVARAKALIPDVVAEVVPNAGHAMTFDRPEYLRQRVTRFLQAGK
jgi:pimeloyl-ACP methyl ester carboxylesterase